MQVPDIMMPNFVKKLVSVLPSKPPAWVLVQTLNQLLKKQILQADMSLLARRNFQIVVEDLGLNLYFTADENKFILANNTVPVDLYFGANMVDFMKMLLRQ